MDTLSSNSSKSKSCSTIINVTPKQIQRTTVRSIHVTLTNFPEHSGNVLCEFSFANKTLTTEATRSRSRVSCPTPLTDSIPAIPSGEHNITAQLSVRPTNGSDFVSTSFVFFECSSFSSCTQCVSSDFPCDWCVVAHRCTHDTAENCHNDVLVQGVSREGPSFRKGPGFCPAIVGTRSGSREILVADNSKKAVRAKVHIIGQFIAGARFVCEFNIEGKKARVNGQLLADTIYCDVMEFNYTSKHSNINASFSILWDGGVKPLDNPDNIYVNIYRCHNLADTCGLCLTLDEKYGCGWCESSNSCEILEQCNKGLGTWIKKNVTCT
ncbi:hypothetical protein WDU94_006631 [Cyamophila willieti]